MEETTKDLLIAVVTKEAAEEEKAKGLVMNMKKDNIAHIRKA
jgi:hypothetical protein